MKFQGMLFIEHFKNRKGREQPNAIEEPDLGTKPLLSTSYKLIFFLAILTSSE